MTPAGLPDTIAQLRALLHQGDLTVADALARQRASFESNPLHCAAALFELPLTAPELSLPLAGVGLAHKDIFALPGRSPGCGTAPTGTPARATSATVMRRLALAGSQPLAALVMAEHACGATGENPHYPLISNPVDLQAAVGGSSSGSAVAVAAGLCYGSLGTDTAGSVRIPAATCGVLGFKPTRGFLPAHGVAPLAPSLDTVGIIARTAADAACVLENIVTPAQAHRFFPLGARPFIDLPVQRDWRIATCWSHPNPAIALDDETHDALQNLATLLNNGDAPPSVALTELPTWLRLAEIMLYVETSHTHRNALRGVGPALTPLTRNVALQGAVVPAGWYLDAVQQRHAHTRQFIEHALQQVDFLLTPALPRGVPDWSQVLTHSASFQAQRLLDLFCWMSFVNYLDLPSVVLPIARDRQNRPISVQVIARPGHDAKLLAFARHVEGMRAYAPFPFSPIH